MREEQAFVAVIAILCASCLVWALIRHCSWVVRSWIETALKRDMVARGYSAQEIVAVVKSDRRCGRMAPLSNVPPAKPVRHPVYATN